MPRAIRRNRGGGLAGGGDRQQQQSTLPMASAAKDSQVLLPEYCSDCKPAVPRELSSEPKQAALAILKYLEPRPVAADLHTATTNSLLEFVESASSHNFQPNGLTAVVPTVHSTSTAVTGKRIVPFPRAPSHFKSCRSIFNFIGSYSGFHAPNLVTLDAVKTLQRMFDWSVAKSLFCMQGSCRLSDRELASYALEQAFGKPISRLLQYGSSSRSTLSTLPDSNFSRFLIFCQLHGTDVSVETAKGLCYGVDSFFHLILKRCCNYLREVWHNDNHRDKGYRFNTLHLKQMLDYDLNLKVLLEPFWRASPLGICHVMHRGEFMSVHRYFPSSSSYIRCTRVLDFMHVSAPYTIIDIAQHALVLLLTGHGQSATVSHVLTLLHRLAPLIGMNTPPDLAIYVAAIQSLCNNGCMFKILLPKSFICRFSDPSIRSSSMSPDAFSADDPREIIHFFCNSLLHSSELARHMTPYAQLECSKFLKRFVACHRVRAAVKRTAIDDAVASSTLDDLKAKLDEAASEVAKIRILEDFIKAPCALLFEGHTYLPKLTQIIATDLLLFHKSPENVICSLDSLQNIDDELMASLKRLAIDVNDAWKSSFAAADTNQQKQMIGERLYVSLVPHYQGSAAEITKRVLDEFADTSQLLVLLDSCALQDTNELDVGKLRQHFSNAFSESPPTIMGAAMSSFDEKSPAIISRLAQIHVQSKQRDPAKVEAKTKLLAQKKRVALESFMYGVLQKLQHSSYKTVSHFFSDVLEEVRSIDLRKKLPNLAVTNLYAFMTSFVRKELRLLQKKLSAAVTNHITITARAMHSYLAGFRPFNFEDLITRTYRMVIHGEISWIQGSKSNSGEALSASQLTLVCQLISNMTTAAVLKCEAGSEMNRSDLLKMCHALNTLGICCNSALQHGPTVRKVSVPKHVIETFDSHAAWSSPPILQVPFNLLSPQAALLEQLRSLRAQFPKDCDPIADLVQQTDARISILEELMMLWSRFIRGDIFEGTQDFSKLLLLLVRHGVEPPMPPCSPIFGAGWATLNGHRISLASGLCYAIIAAAKDGSSADSISARTQMPVSLVQQSIDILSNLGFVRRNEAQLYSACQSVDHNTATTDSQASAQSIPTHEAGEKNEHFSLERDLLQSCSWHCDPDLYVRICFSVFKMLFESLHSVPEWSIIFKLGCSFSLSQVADVLNDLLNRGIITNINGQISLASKEYSVSAASSASSLSQPVLAIHTDPSSSLPLLHWTLFCFDEGANLFADSCSEVKFSHHCYSGGNVYSCKLPFSLIRCNHICFSVRSASLVKIQGHDSAFNVYIELDNNNLNLYVDSKTKSLKGTFLSAEIFSDYWLSWGSAGIAFGRGRLVGKSEVIKMELPQNATAPNFSSLYCSATVMPDDPTTDWIFHDVPQKAPGIMQSGGRSKSLQLSAPEIRSYLTTVLRSIEEVTGGANSGYPFIELIAEYARSQGCAATTLLHRMMCSVSSTPTPSINTDSESVDCGICFSEPSVVVFPCCSTMICGNCLIRYTKQDDFTLKVGATPVGKDEEPLSEISSNGSFGDAILQCSDMNGNAPQLKCPNYRTCKGKITSKTFWKHFKKQLQLAHDQSDDVDSMESIEERFVSKAIKSLCTPSALKAPFAICGNYLSDSDAICGVYHIADSASRIVRCGQCHAQQSVGQMKHSFLLSDSNVESVADDSISTPSALDAFGYPDISPSTLSQWFSKQLHGKFNNLKSSSDRMELSKEMIKSGKYKMCPRCKHGPIEHFACANLRSHAGERNSKGWVIDNRCEVCRFFSANASDWPQYDATVSATAGSYLALLYKDSRDAVKTLENALLHISEWSFECSESLASAVDSVLIARSAIISFFIDSVASYNPDAVQDMEKGRDSINCQWSVTDCIAQLSMHCMNIRFAGTERLTTSPLFLLVNNISYVVKAVQRHFSPAVEEVCKDILGKPDDKIMRERLKTIMPESSSCISDILLPYRHLMVGAQMYASAIFMLESGMFDQDLLARPPSALRHRRRYYYGSNVRFPRFLSFIETCGSQFNGCIPLHVLLALSFSLSPEQLAVYFNSHDDIGIASCAENLISRLAAPASPFRRPRSTSANSQVVLSDSALKKLIISSLTETSQSKDSAKKFGNGSLEDDVVHVQDIDVDDAVESSASGASDSATDDSRKSNTSIAANDATRRTSEFICSAFRKWRRKWLKRARARESSSSDSDSVGPGTIDGDRSHRASVTLPIEANTCAGAASAEQISEDKKTASVFSDIMNPATWFPSDASESVFEKLNPLNWFKQQQSLTSKNEAECATNIDNADTEEACRVLGVGPDFFSPEGSRLSQGSSSASERDSEASGSDRHSVSGASSRTSDFSDGTYTSSSDSGSGASIPVEYERNAGADWASKFKEALGDSSDIVDLGSDDYGDDW